MTWKERLRKLPPSGITVKIDKEIDNYMGSTVLMGFYFFFFFLTEELLETWHCNNLIYGCKHFLYLSLRKCSLKYLTFLALLPFRRPQVA